MTTRFASFPKTWATYAICVAAACLAALDGAGLVKGLLAIVVLVVLGVAAASVVLLVRLPALWSQHRWGVLLPLVVCLICLPGGVAAGRDLLLCRFWLNRDRYDAIANAIRAGKYALPLRDGERSLALAARVTRTAGAVGSVEFLVVSHGYAGAMAFMRDYDASESTGDERGPWRARTALLDGQWYLVSY